ncbi:trap dicarboxylate transporter, dctq subunit [Salmonella enterica subsp. enterica serovar Heidelberg str. CVM24388]|nr:trap dicarboxylate transporter, dctq subunit [Salmonella enterica subsp. enterica serovar Heidelberg str. CVM24388]
MVWVSMLGMAFVAGQKQHISLTLLRFLFLARCVFTQTEATQVILFP